MISSPYQRPDLYERAFAWRDYAKSIDFVIEAAGLAGTDSINSMVELGCGPAQYAREFARRGKTAYGVDLCPEMALHAQKYFDDENLPGYILESDMRSFRLERPVDLAICMMATFGLLLTNQDILDNFAATARALRDGGIYLLELPHPKHVFASDGSKENKWEIEDGALKIDWASDATFDPIAEVSTGTVRFTETREGAEHTYEAPESWRGLTMGVLRALVELSGCFKIAGMYGDLDVNVPFDNSSKAWRLVLVLRKFG
jgi:SAM-dependent methyltransferase